MGKGGEKVDLIFELSVSEYITELDRKLSEEVAEYQQDKNLEEMADVLEVLYAICEERGGFKNKIYLEYVE